MKSVTRLIVVSLNLLLASSVFAQGDGSAEFRANRLDRENLKKVQDHPGSRQISSEVELQVSFLKGYYELKIDGVPSCRIPASKITTSFQTFSCDANYDAKGKLYVGFFDGIYAYFEVYQKGSDQVLADAEVRIGTYQSSKTNNGKNPGLYEQKY